MVKTFATHDEAIEFNKVLIRYGDCAESNVYFLEEENLYVVEWV